MDRHLSHGTQLDNCYPLEPVHILFARVDAPQASPPPRQQQQHDLAALAHDQDAYEVRAATHTAKRRKPPRPPTTAAPPEWSQPSKSMSGFNVPEVIFNVNSILAQRKKRGQV